MNLSRFAFFNFNCLIIKQRPNKIFFFIINTIPQIYILFSQPQHRENIKKYSRP